jgi:NAD(P)-dependent dehydrogenase (short-subunit alcohol dehydrogenase family)
MGKTAIVVGATGGIGEACARDLHRRGFELVLNGRREAVLRALADELDADVVIGDCGDEAVAERLVEGRVSVELLVHAAGILRGTALRDQPAEVFDEVVRTNLRSAYVVVRACLPLMTAGSRIVLVSSMSAVQPMRGLTAYSAAKAGMNAMAVAFAAEVEREGINVNLVSPGPVATPMMDESVNRFSVLRAEDVAEVVGWLSELPPRVVIPDIFFRAPFSGPYVEQSGGDGTAGVPQRRG